MSKIKVAVAGPLADEKALWRGDAQAVQGDVGDFGLEHKARRCLQGQRGAAARALSPTQLQLELLFVTQKELPPRPVHSPVASLLCPAVLGAGQRAGDKAGEALPWWICHRGLRWYDVVVKGMDSVLCHPSPASMSLSAKWAQ